MLVSNELHQLEWTGTNHLIGVTRMLLSILSITINVFRNYCA